MTKSYKQILIICGLVGVIIAGIVIYFFQNKQEDYTYLEITNEEEIVNTVEENIEEEKIVVHITGEVVNQGIITVKKGSRIIDAIEAAGGTTQNADLSKINLAYTIEDGIKIYVPSIEDSKEEEWISEESGENVITSGSNKKEEKLMVNINTAKIEELEQLPGIGESIATRIVNYRTENGKFSSIDDIKNVSGIGDSKFNNIKNYICVK